MRRARRVLAGCAAAALLAGCQPLPHPFADDRPPAALLRVRDSAGVAVAPVAGKPRAVAEPLAGAVAAALLKHDIPASARTTGLASYLLNGRIEEVPALHGRSIVVATWRLRNPSGRLVAERQQQVEADSAEWTQGADKAVAELAAQSANLLAPLLVDQPPKMAPEGGRTRIVVSAVTGAPGDGDRALAAALATVLKRRDLDIAAGGKPERPDDLVIDAEVAVAPAAPGKQHVKIVWRVRHADGSEIGNVVQENDVPKGSLDAAWGDLAYTVAIAAESGIADILARGMKLPDARS